MNKGNIIDAIQIWYSTKVDTFVEVWGVGRRAKATALDFI